MTYSKWSIALLGVAVLAVVAMVSGCGGKETSERAAEEIVEQAIEKAGGGNVDIDVDGDKVTMTGDDYRMESTETTEWPDNLPDDVPQFTYGKIERVARGEKAETGEFNYNIWVHDIDAEAAAKYEADLKKAGWETNAVSVGEQGGMVTAEKGDLGVTFMHSKEEHRGNIMIVSQ